MSGTTVLPNISFTEISYDIRRPQTIIEVGASYANVGLISFPTKVLLAGQANGNPGGPYQIFRKGQAGGLWGVNSPIARMADRFLDANPQVPLYAYGTGLGAGTAATGTATLSGVMAASTAVPLYIGGRYIPVVLSSSTTLSTQAATIAAAINADAVCPMSATSSGAVITLTAKFPGEVGNALPISVGGPAADELSPPGTWACTIVPMAGGAGTPDLTPLLARIANDWYTDIVIGYLDSGSQGIIEAEAEARYTATGRKDVHVWTAYSQSLGAALTAGPQRNSRFVTRLPVYASATPPWEWIAAAAGAAIFQLANDPSRQLRGIAIPGVYAPPPKSAFLDTDREQLLRNGMSTFRGLSDGTCVWERAITSYQTSPLGVPDSAWLDVMVPKTMTRIRYDWISFVGLNYPRHKLADDDTPAAAFSDVCATPRRLWNSWVGRTQLYEQVAWIEQAARTNKGSYFKRDLSDHNRANGRQLVRIIGNLMVLAGRLEFEA